LPYRWGIVSAGLISHDFVNALSTHDASEHVVVAVAARNMESAEKFAKKFGIPKAYAGDRLSENISCIM
jgi:dihydrodiol dehydrogenase / D-xylose 1-dehydrogenase (NADP)